jgi:transketolase
MASKSQKREPEVSPEVCRLREELEMEKRKLTEERLSMAQAQQVKEQETANQFEMMMNQANQRHQEMIEETQRRNENLLQESNQQHQQLLDVNDMAYRTHVQQLQHQLCWLTTLVGEERIQEVMNDPQKYAEASAQAQLLRENMNSVNQGPQ